MRGGFFVECANQPVRNVSRRRLIDGGEFQRDHLADLDQCRSIIGVDVAEPSANRLVGLGGLESPDAPTQGALAASLGAVGDQGIVGYQGDIHGRTPSG